MAMISEKEWFSSPRITVCQFCIQLRERPFRIFRVLLSLAPSLNESGTCPWSESGTGLGGNDMIGACRILDIYAGGNRVVSGSEF
jgi:hypothetical protein